MYVTTVVVCTILGFSTVESVIVVIGVVVSVVLAVEHTVVVGGVGVAVTVVVGLVKTIVGMVNVEVVVAITTVPVGKVVGVTEPPMRVSRRKPILDRIGVIYNLEPRRCMLPEQWLRFVSCQVVGCGHEERDHASGQPSCTEDILAWWSSKSTEYWSQ